MRPLIQEREPYATVYQIFMAHQTRHLRRRLWVEWLGSLTSRMLRANISAVVKMPKKDGQINKLTVRKQRRPWSGAPLIGRPLSAVVKCSLIKGINEHQWTSMNSVQWIVFIEEVHHLSMVHTERRFPFRDLGNLKVLISIPICPQVRADTSRSEVRMINSGWL